MKPKVHWLTAAAERLVFGRRRLTLAFFAIATLAMGWQAASLRVDAGFLKLVPVEHQYMQTFLEHRDEFGGANRVAVALVARSGDMFTADFFSALEQVTDAVFFLPGVDRTQVYSLFTPNVRYLETVEDGLNSGNVLPADFEPTENGLAQVRENILKAGIVGRLVASDFSGALVSAQLQEFNPNTGERLDYRDVALALEEIRSASGGPDSPVDIHIIGFAQLVGEIASGATRVVMFFVLTILLTAFFLFVHTRSLRLTLMPITCALAAMVWQLGAIVSLGYGIDPMSILVPFLVFAIGVSHGVQMVGSTQAEASRGAPPLEAARISFCRILLPGAVALASDTAGFITISLIEVPVIREIAISASLGVAAIILTNLGLLPVMLSFARVSERDRKRGLARDRRLHVLWVFLARITRRGPSLTAMFAALVLVAGSAYFALSVRIGDLHHGAPELRAESVYNRDVAAIVERFEIGVDVLTIFAESRSEACIDYRIMDVVDRFEWHMANVEGVQSVAAMSGVVRSIASGLKEGNLKWWTIPRDPYVLAQTGAFVPTRSGLLNSDCSVMPVHVYTEDHRSETIERVVDAAKAFASAHPDPDIAFRLSGGNVGVMAATNEEVAAAQFPILGYVYGAVVLLCLFFFRSFAATACIVLPLAGVSLLAYALMAILEIGLKVSTLPVVALGIGIGVDYGIYVYGRLRLYLAEGLDFESAYLRTLDTAGSAVMVTGLTLAAGVATWIAAPLKLQADMGAVLTFMFLVNMIGALVLLPALGVWLIGPRPGNSGREKPDPPGGDPA